MTTVKKNPYWSLALSGLIAILYAILALFVPELTLVNIVRYFGLIIILVGVAMLLAAIRNIRNELPYGVLLAEAVITIVIGSLIFIYTVASLEFFFIIIGLWALVVGVVQLYLLVTHEFPKNDKTLLFVNGLISIVFGLILLFNPFEAATTLFMISGVLALALGILLLYLFYRLWSMTKTKD